MQERIKKLLEFFAMFSGFRRFFVIEFVIVVSLLLLLGHILTSGLWVDLIKSTVIAFFASNSVESFSDVTKAWLEKNKL